jgi:hypothetical protein
MNRLENSGAIQFDPEKRGDVHQMILEHINPFILTEEDLREQTFESIGARSHMLSELDASEEDRYRAARSVLKAKFGENELHGFYFQKPLKDLGNEIAKILMTSELIDEVFFDDEQLVKSFLDIVRRFNPIEA